MIHNLIAFSSLFLLTFTSLLYFAESVSLLKNETDHLALLAFKAEISDDSNTSVLSSWNDSLHFCMWAGVTCGRRHPQRVVALNLTAQSLRGSLSPHIGNMTFLRSIILSKNKLEGHIPQEIGKLFRLRNLRLGDNSFYGEIPNNLTQCLRLEYISLYANNLVGEIPSNIGSLSKLYWLNLEINELSGRIPPSLGNLSLLERLILTENNLNGRIPDELGRLGNLQNLGLSQNKYSGVIPPSVYNLSLLSIIDVGQNQLHGTLPPDMGLILPNLEEVYVGNNSFTGHMPVSLGNASRLSTLDFGLNSFGGSVPMNLGRLKSLEWLNVAFNQLAGGEKDEEFIFITSLTNCSGLQTLDLNDNHFSGKLPNSIANLSTQLTEILLGGNQILGAIPTGLENLANLISLGMDDNLLIGTIPFHLMKLKRLQSVRMSGNTLSGQIPISIGNLTELYELDLSRNNLQGSIPQSLGNCQHLRDLILFDNNLNGTIHDRVPNITSLSRFFIDMNSLTGSLPLGIGNLKNLFHLNVSNNKLSGEIPSTLSTCVSLQYLNMEGNLFHGSIPPSLGALRGLQELDLSRNNLTGHIPSDLAEPPFLQYLNLSFNNLEGEVPKLGIFQNVSALSIFGNGKLCGGIPELQLPKCPKQDFKKKKKHLSPKVIILVVVVVAASVLFSFLLLYFLAIRSKKLRGKRASRSSMKGGFSRVTYRELFKATNGFSSASLIGAGSYGSVYKGIIDGKETIVAIKVLRLQQGRASKSFIAECRALGSIKHRNIVKILTVCSSIDFNGNDFKALVLEYMSNGSLDNWLHKSADELHQFKTLSLTQRLNVAIDIACALDYLHNHCEAPIIHCDLKPSNVLLDEDMVAHVGDFGLARILSEDINYSRSQTNSLAIRGTIGYVAPEYGTGANVSIYGDVYSYGILLLEMLTGKRPSHDMFTNNLSLHQFAKTVLPERVMEIIDNQLLSEENEMIRHNENYNEIRAMMHECIISLVKLEFLEAYRINPMIGSNVEI
ncbi:hypothetical protein MRB53_013540 [Persea americana]|uniref:Uncharacterized protein n=1 Tax=Persea americana TaxID=3435 RepID=A0ACC2K8R5_PERAE|nr:hypothetical protein MRB53_013540 [Persea americana]